MFGSMVRGAGRLFGFGLVVGLMAGCAGDGAIADPTESANAAVLAVEAADIVTIQISPSTLVLGDAGTWVTVHADVPYASVATSTVTLAGIPAAATFPDQRGDLVVKVHQSDVEPLVEPPTATLQLRGQYTAGGAFEGSDQIAVKTSGPRN